MIDSIQTQCQVLAVVIFLGVTAAPLPAQVLESDALQRKQDDQQRARSLTRDLLGGVLDVQLRQLEENGLSDQEIYRDIKLMRQNLNHLVETEMSNVVELLSEAQRLPKEKREASFVEARRLIRTIVRQLAIERQNLLKRLKITELAEQIRRLIRQQSVVQTATKGLPSEQQSRQEALTLKAIEDQRDVKELFLQLVDAMIEMKSFSGMLATAAADGLRILKAADVGQHLDAAGRDLKGVQYVAAFDEQELVIKGLMELLKIIEQAQGTLTTEKMPLLDRLRVLTEKQKQLRDETKLLPENQPPSAQLVEQQSQIQKEIVQLFELADHHPKYETHIQQAETAALDAATNLLENKPEVAMADQGRVLGNLASLELALKEQAKQNSKDKSADELAQAVKVLSEIRASLVEAAKKQNETKEKAEQNAQSAAPDALEVAEILQQALRNDVLPSAVKASIAKAADSADESAKTLDAATTEKATDAEKAALLRVSDSIDRATRMVDGALADTQRQASAVKIGELARAAEVLERASAEERSIANQASLIAQSKDINSDDSKHAAMDLTERQSNVRAIAEKSAEALAQTSPAASKEAAEGAKSTEKSISDLQTIAGHKTDDPKSAAERAAQAALTASQNLASAAKEIREEIMNTANKLARQTLDQAEELAKARGDVEKAAEVLPSYEKVSQLTAAKEKLDEAMKEQARARGQLDAAAAIEVTGLIAKALDAQEAASTAATAARTGIGSELKATIRQEEVAERSLAAAEAAAKRPQAESAKTRGESDPLVVALHEAQNAASQAAKQTLDGNPVSADTARRFAEAGLKKALELAQSEAEAVRNAPSTGQPDKQAQAKAAASAAAAQKLAAKASVESGNDLASAAEAAETANQLMASQSDQAPAAQAKSAGELLVAEKKLHAAIKNAAAEQAKSLARQANESQALAVRVAAVDPTAANAIDSAASHARMGSQAEVAPRQMSEAANSAELALEHAAAELGAKEQELRRDEAIAASVANLVRDQQIAAEMIAEQAAELEKIDSAMTEGSAPAKSQQAAAQKLNNAQQQFADSQRATGQGAVELSGQTEVANPPLREALDLASKLPLGQLLTDVMPENVLPNGPPVPTDSQPLPEGQPAANNKPMPGKDAAASTKDQGEANPSERPAQGTPVASNPNGLGTGFVPQSPQVTAEMMAGPKAQQAAQKVLGQQLIFDQKPSTGQPMPPGQTSDFEEDGANSNDPANSSKLTRKAGSAATNQKVKEGPLDKQKEGTDAMEKTANSPRGNEESVASRQLKDEAWFARLPPELRKSIRAGAGQKPPRAYEERLKKYFQSVD